MTGIDDVANAPLLEVSGARFGYGDLTAVWDVSLTARAGRTCALVGRNGAGKTTFLAGVAGLLPLMSGRVVLRGEDVSTMPAHRRVRQGICLVQEGRRIFRALTVQENLMLGLFGRDRASKKADAVLDEMYERFPVLKSRARSVAGSLSGGQQQMLAIAQAMVSRPTVLMLDEPSSGLAPVAMDEVLEIIDGLRKEGMAIVLVEQLLEDVLSGVADDVVLIEHGRVVLADAAANISLEQLAEVASSDATS